MPRRTPLALVAAAAVLLAVPAVAVARTYEVYAGFDGIKTAPKQASPNAFFPRAVTVHDGDSVQWKFRGFHTVTFPVRGEGPPPLALATPNRPVSGVDDAAGNPFWFNGQPSVFVNPVAAVKHGTSYNGSGVINSGLPAGSKPKDYALRFRRRGNFFYYCTIHPGMRGVVRVVAKSRDVLTPEQSEHKGDSEVARYVANARRLNAAAPPSDPTTVSAGRATPVFTIDRFFPTTRTITAGQTVTFTMAGQFRSEIHTVTFGPEKARTRLERTFITGAPPQLNPLGVYSSDPLPLPAYDGSNHGDGFLNSGLIDNDPASPFPDAVQVTFPKPGTYAYECVIHEKMDGKIVVR